MRYWHVNLFFRAALGCIILSLVGACGLGSDEGLYGAGAGGPSFAQNDGLPHESDRNFQQDPPVETTPTLLHVAVRQKYEEDEEELRREWIILVQAINDDGEEIGFTYDSGTDDNGFATVFLDPALLGFPLRVQALNKVTLVSLYAMIPKGSDLSKVYDIDLLRSHVREAGLYVTFWTGVLLKPLSNQQMQEWNPALLKALFEVGGEMPSFCAQLYACCRPA